MTEHEAHEAIYRRWLDLRLKNLTDIEHLSEVALIQIQLLQLGILRVLHDGTCEPVPDVRVVDEWGG